MKFASCKQNLRRSKMGVMNWGWGWGILSVVNSHHLASVGTGGCHPQRHFTIPRQVWTGQENEGKPGRK